MVVAVIAFLVASGGISLDSDGEADPLALSDAAPEEADGGALPPEEQPAQRPGVARSLDEPFQFGDLRVLVSDLQRSAGVGAGGEEVRALGEFALVTLTVRNTGAAPLRLADRLRLLDSAGRTFTPDGAATAVAAGRAEDRADALAVEIQPGHTVDLLVVFDVAADAEGLRLRLSGGFIEVPLDP